ncbi:MAG TPA: dockerin type 1 [Clostridiales bacterium]|nr:dockerin type 1 [Clostridiales bacterium]
MGFDQIYKKCRKIAVPLAVISCLALLPACSTSKALSSTTAKATSASASATTAKTAASAASTISGEGALSAATAAILSALTSDGGDGDSVLDQASVSDIKLNGNSITCSSGNAIVEGSTITILFGGIYNISGTLNNGQIIVNTKAKETVKLVLNGVDITCQTSAPIYVKNADKVILTLADGTNNRVRAGSAYIFDNVQEEEPDAAIFSKDDLTINGTGSLTVEASFRHGILSKDDLKINGGNIAVHASGDGLRGRDSIVVKDGSLTVQAGSDGLQSNNAEAEDKGYVVILGGTLHVTAGADGIQAESLACISSGELDITTGGGSTKTVSAASGTSAKGIKAARDLIIEGGTIQLNCADDTIHSDGSITIHGGILTASTSDDGMHAEKTITINGGDLNIKKSYEGIEAATITFNDRTLHMVSSDDGFNVSDGSADAGFGGRPGQAGATATNLWLNIHGGYIYLDANGDGLDSNGSVSMTDGFVLVNGPVQNNNGAVDYNGSFKMTGGFLVAVGSSGMAEAPDSTSTVCTALINLTASQTAGTLIRIQSDSGNIIAAFQPTKTFQSIVVSSSSLIQGQSYTVYTGGSYSGGTVKDGLCTGGTASGGTQAATFTLSGIVTQVGTSAGPGGGGGGFPRR